jgi:hypothetical protein
MKKYYFVLIATLFSGNCMSAQIVDDLIDDPGDIAFTAYHDNADGFSFVFLDNCPDGTSIRFVDEEWNGSAFASATTEGEVLWTNNTGSTIVQGTVIHIENANDNLPGISASSGVAIEDDGGFSLDLSDDGIIAITGTRSSPGVFLAFFGDTTDSSLSGTSLVNGFTANQHASYGAGYYSGVTNCDGLSIAECSERINNHTNWTVATTFTYPGAVMSSLEVSGVLKNQKHQKNITTRCYPNPTKNKVEIVSDLEIGTMSLYNSLGRRLLFIVGNKKKVKLDLQGYEKGIYILELDFKQEKEIIKIIKE